MEITVIGLGASVSTKVAIVGGRAAVRRVFVFFFQAEDGIRDYKVTGVQTCALPISNGPAPQLANAEPRQLLILLTPHGDRKSTRLNSSHLVISYAVFCLKKKKCRIHESVARCAALPPQQLRRSCSASLHQTSSQSTY